VLAQSWAVFRCEKFWGKVPVALFVVIWQILSMQLVIFLPTFNAPCIRRKIRCDSYYTKKFGSFWVLNMALAVFIASYRTISNSGLYCTISMNANCCSCVEQPTVVRGVLHCWLLSIQFPAQVLFSFSKTPKKYTMQKEDSLSHQTCDTYMEY
jgi:hypothetical protein